MTRLFLALLVAASLQPLANARTNAGKLEALLRREMSERRIPGLQVAVVRHEKIVLLRSYGVADLQHSVPVNDRSIFPINSCTKAFTGVAIMQLVEQGKIDLASPVSAYLEGLPESWRHVKVRQLPSHASGVPRGRAVQLQPDELCPAGHDYRQVRGAALFVYREDDLAVVVLTNRAGAFPEEFIDELAGFYVPGIPESDPITALRVRLRGRGFEHAVEVYKELKSKDAGFRPSETDLNDWAYRMLNGGGKPKEALEIFKLNALLYPDSANVYDSFAEAFEVNGRRDQAIKNYRRSLELDPNNRNAASRLKQLDPEYK